MLGSVLLSSNIFEVVVSSIGLLVLYGNVVNSTLAPSVVILFISVVSCSPDNSGCFSVALGLLSKLFSLSLTSCCEGLFVEMISSSIFLGS